MLNIFKVSEEYKSSTKQFKLIDLYLSIVLYALVIVLYYFMGSYFVRHKSLLSDRFILISTGIVTLIIIGVILSFCILRKQKLNTIGFDRIYIKQSLKLGLIVSGVVVIGFMVVALLTGFNIRHDFIKIMIRLFYYLIEIAFLEELIFRAFIGSRLYGLFKNKLLSIGITGILFVFMHLPFQVVFNEVSVTEYLMSAWPNLIFVFVLHLLMQFLYAKYNHILAPTLFHFTWDYIQWLLF